MAGIKMKWVWVNQIKLATLGTEVLDLQNYSTWNGITIIFIVASTGPSLGWDPILLSAVKTYI